MTHVGSVREITRYPVKSMAGVAMHSAHLGWHGLAGDRRFAFRRIGDHSGFPFLTASRLPELVLYHAIEFDDTSGEPLPTHVRTPSGARVALHSAELQAELTERFGSPVELLKLKNGIFDEGEVLMISAATVKGIGAAAGMGVVAGIDLDARRFRANLLLETEDQSPFTEDEWIGRTLTFGESASGPAVSITLRDARCVMINLDPDSAQQDRRVLKTVVRLNENNAGVYATVVRTGTIRVGDPVGIV